MLWAMMWWHFCDIKVKLLYCQNSNLTKYWEKTSLKNSLCQSVFFEMNCAFKKSLRLPPSSRLWDVHLSRFEGGKWVSFMQNVVSFRTFSSSGMDGGLIFFPQIIACSHFEMQIILYVRSTQTTQLSTYCIYIFNAYM